MDSIEDAFDRSRALVFGIGGGGDVIGTLPTVRLLEAHNVETIIGGIAWERSVIDRQPGPRSLKELEHVNRVSEALAMGTAETHTHDDIQFAETAVAAQLERKVALLDVTGGVAGLHAGLETACRKLGIDLIIGTDSGGDVLATGTEPGIVSPLADAISLAALSELSAPTCIGMLGYGSDGELTRSELHRNIGAVADDGGLLGSWGLTRSVGCEIEQLIENIPTDASRLPLRVSQGEVGTHTIRNGKRTVDLTPAATVTFYFDTATVADRSAPMSIVTGTKDIEEANKRLKAAGYDTELSHERNKD